MKLFRHCLLVFLLLALFLGVVNTVYAAEPERTVRVGAYNNNPKIYRDVNDKPAGVFADILNYIAKKENWTLEYVFGTWDTGLTRLEKGEIDVMVDVAVSEERKKLFDFTNETVLNSWAVIYVQKDSTIDSIMDLDGKEISIQKSSVYEAGQEGIEHYISAFEIETTIVEVNNYREALDLLELGKVDAAIVSHIFGLANQKNYPNVKATRIFLKPTELRFALTKRDSDNPYLVERLDYWVKKLKDGQDNYLNQTLEKYGLQELESQPEVSVPRQKEAVPFKAVQVALIVLILLSSFWIMRAIVLKSRI